MNSRPVEFPRAWDSTIHSAWKGCKHKWWRKHVLGLKSKGSLIGNEFGVNPPRPIINWTGLPCLLPARTAWAQIADKLRNLRSHGAQLRVNPN